MCWELTTCWTHCGCERVDEQPCEKMTFDIGDCGRGVTPRRSDKSVRCRQCLDRVRLNEIAIAEGARKHQDNLAGLRTWCEQFGRSYGHLPDEWDAPPLDDFAAMSRYGNGDRGSSGRTRTGSSYDDDALSQGSPSTVRPSSAVSTTSPRRSQSHQSQSGSAYGGGSSYGGSSDRRSSRNHYQDDSYYSGGRSHSHASRSHHSQGSDYNSGNYYYSDDYASGSNGQGSYYSYGSRSGSSRRH